MKNEVVIITCDLCDQEIPADELPFVLKIMSGSKTVFKKVGCDMVLTPRRHRLYARNGKAMIRVNASFYCGVAPSGTEELHFHNLCIDAQIKKRLMQYYLTDSDEDVTATSEFDEGRSFMLGGELAFYRPIPIVDAVKLYSNAIEPWGVQVVVDPTDSAAIEVEARKLFREQNPDLPYV